MLKFLEGKKTYIIAAIAAIAAAAEALGYQIPVYVFEFLGALGLYTVRSALK